MSASKPQVPSAAVDEEDRQHHADRGRAEVGAGDHRLAADRVEQPPERHRAEEVADREDDDEDRHDRRGDAEEGREQGAEVEGDAVVDEGLTDEQREAEDRPLRIELERGAGDLRGRGSPCAGALRCFSSGSCSSWPVSSRTSLLDPVDDLLGLLLATVDEQPARALGTLRRTIRIVSPSTTPSPKASRQPRSAAKIEVSRKSSASRRAGRRAQPVGAVDDQVDAAAHPRRDQLVDRRVDRRVLAADAGAGEEAGGEEVPGGEGEGGRRGGAM